MPFLQGSPWVHSHSCHTMKPAFVKVTLTFSLASRKAGLHLFAHHNEVFRISSENPRGVSSASASQRFRPGTCHRVLTRNVPGLGQFLGSLYGLMVSKMPIPL